MSALNHTHICECDVYVQLDKDGSKYIHLSSLPEALSNDRDLASTLQVKQTQSLQTLYVTTGCDYTSFFHGIGKVAFIDFISTQISYQLEQTTLEHFQM